MEIKELIFLILMVLMCGAYFYFMEYAGKRITLDMSTSLNNPDEYIKEGLKLSKFLHFCGHITIVVGFIVIGIAVYQRGIS